MAFLFSAAHNFDVPKTADVSFAVRRRASSLVCTSARDSTKFVDRGFIGFDTG